MLVDVVNLTPNWNVRVKLPQIDGYHLWNRHLAKQPFQHGIQPGLHQRRERGGVTDDDHGSGGHRGLFGEELVECLQIALEVVHVIRHRNATLAEQLHELGLGYPESISRLPERETAVHEQTHRKPEQQFLRAASGLLGE